MQKRRCEESVHGHCIVDRFGQVWSCCFDISARIPTKLHTRTKKCLGRFLSPFRSARLIGSGGTSPLSRFSWRKVWTGVKCNFSSAQLHDQYVVGKLPISRVRMWNFTRIRHKKKKLWLLIIPARTLLEQPGLGPPPKRCELQLFFAGVRQAVWHWKALDIGRLNMQFQQDWPKDEKITALLYSCRKT